MLGLTVRIVSYNVRYFSHALKGLASTATSKARIGEALSALRPLPDLICLQEVEKRSFRSGVAHRGLGAETQLEAFMRHLRHAFKAEGIRCPYAAYYFPAHVYGGVKVRLYTTGLAVLVNQEKLHVLRHNMESPHNITHYGGAPIKKLKQTRIVAHLELEDHKGHCFHVFNTHLSLPSPFRRGFWKGQRMGHGPNQLDEARSVTDFIRQCAAGGSYVLCGDFNAAPASPVYQYLVDEAGLVAAQESLAHIDVKKPKGFPTAGFLNLRMHLDHLFGAGVKWVDLDGTANFDDEQGRFYGLSDHVPLIATFELNKQASSERSAGR